MILLSFLFWLPSTRSEPVDTFNPETKFARYPFDPLLGSQFNFIKIDSSGANFAYFLTLTNASIENPDSEILGDDYLGQWIRDICESNELSEPKSNTDLRDVTFKGSKFGTFFPQFWSMTSSEAFGMTLMANTELVPKKLILTFEFGTFDSNGCDQIYISTKNPDHFIIRSRSSGAYDGDWTHILDENLQYICFYLPSIPGGTVSFDMNFTVNSEKGGEAMVSCTSPTCSSPHAIQSIFPSVKINYVRPGATVNTILFYRLNVKAIVEFHYLDIFFQDPESLVPQVIPKRHWHFPAKTVDEDGKKTTCVWEQNNQVLEPKQCWVGSEDDMLRDILVYGEFPTADYIPPRTLSVTISPLPTITPGPTALQTPLVTLTLTPIATPTRGFAPSSRFAASGSFSISQSFTRSNVFSPSNHFIPSGRFDGTETWTTPAIFDNVVTGTPEKGQESGGHEGSGSGNGNDSGGLAIWIIVVIAVVGLLLIAGIIIGIILWRRKRSAPIEPLPGEEKGSEEEKEDKMSVLNGSGNKSFGEEQLSDQLIDPDAHGDDLVHEPIGLDRPETQIPESSDFDAIPDIHDIDL